MCYTFPCVSIEANYIFQFDDAGLHPAMLENIKLCGYRVPTPIQAYCLPAVLTNHDVIAVAQTGMSFFFHQ